MGLYKYFEKNKQYAENKHKQRNPVYAVHIF